MSTLKDSNRSLTGLVVQRLEVLEKTAKQIAEDPIYLAGSEADSVVDPFAGDAPDGVVTA